MLDCGSLLRRATCPLLPLNGNTSYASVLVPPAILRAPLAPAAANPWIPPATMPLAAQAMGLIGGTTTCETASLPCPSRQVGPPSWRLPFLVDVTAPLICSYGLWPPGPLRLT